MLSTLCLASDSTFRLSVSTFQFRPYLRIALVRCQGPRHVFPIVFLVLYPDSCFQGYPTVAPRSSFPAYPTPSVPPFQCCPCHCFGIVFICVLATCLVASVSCSTVRPRPYASLLGPTLRPVLPLYLSVLVLSFLPFDQWSHVDLPSPTLRTLALSWAVCYVFSCFRLFLLCFSTNGSTLAYFFAYWLFLCNRPFGTTLQTLNLSGFQSVTRVLSSLPTLFPRPYLTLGSLRMLALSGVPVRVRWADCH